MGAITAQISSKFQIVIPKEVRETLHLQPRDTILFLIDGDSVHIRPKPESYTDTLRGLHKRHWSDVDTWLENERSTWD